MTADNGSPLRIRPFRPEDQRACQALVLAGLGEHFGVIDPARNPDLDDITAHYIVPGHLFVVVERAGVLVGTGALVREGPTTGRLVRMSVHRDHRRRGIGRALVIHLIACARQRGYAHLLVETNHDWEDALALYRACGFHQQAGASVGELELALR
jgi:GNAT superfamily N-acetyltransferase